MDAAEQDLLFKEPDPNEEIENQNGWIKLRNPETGATGYVPKEYVRELSAKPKITRKPSSSIPLSRKSSVNSSEF